MKGKDRKHYQIALSITTWILCALSSSFAYSFLSNMPWSFQARFLVGLLLIMTPLSVSWLIFELFQKEKRHTEK